MNLILIVILLMLVFGGWGVHTYGQFGPGYTYGLGGLGGVLVLLIILRLLGII